MVGLSAFIRFHSMRYILHTTLSLSVQCSCLFMSYLTLHTSPRRFFRSNTPNALLDIFRMPDQTPRPPLQNFPLPICGELPYYHFLLSSLSRLLCLPCLLHNIYIVEIKAQNDGIK